jgi:hypothetical protein
MSAGWSVFLPYLPNDCSFPHGINITKPLKQAAINIIGNVVPAISMIPFNIFLQVYLRTVKTYKVSLNLHVFLEHVLLRDHELIGTLIIVIQLIEVEALICAKLTSDAPRDGTPETDMDVKKGSTLVSSRLFCSRMQMPNLTHLRFCELVILFWEVEDTRKVQDLWWERGRWRWTWVNLLDKTLTSIFC